MKRRVTQMEIARRANVNVSTVSKILTLGHAARFRRPTIERVLAIARRLGYDFSRLKHVHRRRAERRPIGVRAEVKILLEDGRLFDRGIATIRDLSATGALIDDLALPGRALPGEPFEVLLRPVEGELAALEVPGRVVRLVQGVGSLALGIEFAPVLPEPVRRSLAAAYRAS